MKTPHDCTYKSKQSNELRQIFPSMPHVPITSYADMRQPCQFIHLIWNQCSKNVTMITGMYTFQITGICPWRNMPPTLHICVTLHFFVVYIQIPHSCKHPPQIKKLQHILLKILQNMCHELICPSNATCPNYLMCIYGGGIPIYVPQKKTPWSKLWSLGRATDRQMYGLQLYHPDS